eukprot:scaffold170677_cov19-Prasinocladus_malaysianus.AAC.1
MTLVHSGSAVLLGHSSSTRRMIVIDAATRTRMYSGCSSRAKPATLKRNRLIRYNTLTSVSVSIWDGMPWKPWLLVYAIFDCNAVAIWHDRCQF